MRHGIIWGKSGLGQGKTSTKVPECMSGAKDRDREVMERIGQGLMIIVRALAFIQNKMVAMGRS